MTTLLQRFPRLVGVLCCILLFVGCATTSPPLFDPASHIYAIAKDTEVYRTANPTRDNYCSLNVYILPRVIVALAENRPAAPGQITRIFQRYFTGHDQKSNVEHCQQRALRWVQFITLPQLIYPLLSKIAGVYILIYTQVRACSTCVPSFPTWERTLQGLVHARPDGKGVELKLYVWEIKYLSPSGFDPELYPQGPATPGPAKPGTFKPVHVRFEDLRQVYP
jgi:hypothetical protein